MTLAYNCQCKQPQHPNKGIAAAAETAHVSQHGFTRGVAVNVCVSADSRCGIRQVKLRQDKEVVCMAVCDHLVAVGTQSFVSLIDPRCSMSIFDIVSRDPSHGTHPFCLLKVFPNCCLHPSEFALHTNQLYAREIELMAQDSAGCSWSSCCHASLPMHSEGELALLHAHPLLDITFILACFLKPDSSC